MEENLEWLALVDIPVEEREARVQDYWNEEKGWDEYLFQGILPDVVLDRLMAFTLSTEKDVHDELLWAPESSEVKEAFQNRKKPGNIAGKSMRSFLRWIKPMDGWYKLNTDGSRDAQSGKIGCGGVLRDSNGDWIWGFSCNLGEGSIMEAEAWGILKGLKLTWDHGYRKVIIESDAKKVVDWITTRERNNLPIGNVANIISECKRWIGRDWVVRVIHIHREQNNVADWLAKKALAGSRGLSMLSQPETGILELLVDDSMGVPRQRVVSIVS
nr:putative ribonuclease H-like domain-containing protein [Ipomoea batatas]